MAGKTLELSIVRRFLIVVVQTAFADGNDFLWFSESDEFSDARFMVVILGTRMNAGGVPKAPPTSASFMRAKTSSISS